MFLDTVILLSLNFFSMFVPWSDILIARRLCGLSAFRLLDFSWEIFTLSINCFHSFLSSGMNLAEIFQTLISLSLQHA